MRDGPIRAQHLGLRSRLGTARRAPGMPTYLIAAEAGGHASAGDAKHTAWPPVGSAGAG
jgi:hypothetical protein